LTIRAGADRRSSGSSSSVSRNGALPARPVAPDPGVVDQHVEPLLVAADLAPEPAHLLQRGEVGEVGVEAVAPGRLHDLAAGVLQPRLGPPVQQDGGAARGELARERPAKAVGGPGDQDGLLIDGSHRRHASAGG